jgi:lysophospholipase L1-like esterase
MTMAAFETHPMSKFRRYVLLPCLAIVISSIVGLVLIEVMLRIVDYSRPPFWQYDADTGNSLRPNTEGWYVKEAAIKISVNSKGLRGSEIPIEKPAGVFRIVVLGDSFAEGFQVRFRELFSKIVQDRLNSDLCPRGSTRVEVLNFGVSGYGQAREILAFRHKALRFHPDLVLVLFHGGNDFRNNTKEWEHNPFNPYFVFDGSGHLRLDRSALDSPAFGYKLRWSNLRNDIVAHVRVLQVLQDFYERVILTRNLVADETETHSANSAGGYVRALPIAPPESDLDKKAWALTEAHFHLLASEAKAATDHSLWVANVPPSLAILPNSDERRRVLAELGLDDADYVEHRLTSFFKSENIAFVPLTTPLRQAAEKTGIDMHYQAYLRRLGGHWNAAAHRVAGETIADALCPIVAGVGGHGAITN